MQWSQNYAALNGSLLLTGLVVAIPIYFLFWALAVKRMKGHLAGLLTLLITIIISITVYRMPVSATLSAAALGMVNGLFPIGWTILTAVFLFNLTVASGQFEVIKGSISALSPDRLPGGDHGPGHRPGHGVLVALPHPHGGHGHLGHALAQGLRQQDPPILHDPPGNRGRGGAAPGLRHSLEPSGGPRGRLGVN
jgi:hypothetical protein